MKHSLGEKGSEERREARFIEVAVGNRDHRILKFVRVWGRHCNAGELQRQQCRSDGGSLIPIEESLRLHDVECVRGSYSERICVGVVEVVLGLRDGTFKPTFITQAGAAAVLMQGASMESQHHLGGQKDWFCHGRTRSLGQAAQKLAMRLKDCVHRFCHTGIARINLTVLALGRAAQLSECGLNFVLLLGRHPLHLFDNFRDRHVATIA